MRISVRRSVESDAPAACNVVRRSITDLCVADHQNDHATVAEWLENKTVVFFQRVINAESNSCVVATLDGKICGFGHINHTGVIGLLYVAPEARFMGVSTAMLEWLESEAPRLGIPTVTLESSLTAKKFYEARGYVQSGEPTPGYGITNGWPMEKRLLV
jgi:GNAT superfamily N-acetyltransferase